MNSSYEPSPLIIDPFVLHFLSSTIQPPPPLPLPVFFYDPFLVVPPPPPPTIITSPSCQVRFSYSIRIKTFHHFYLEFTNKIDKFCSSTLYTNSIIYTSSYF